MKGHIELGDKSVIQNAAEYRRKPLKKSQKEMTLNFAQPEIAEQISNELTETHDLIYQLARDQEQIVKQMRDFRERIPAELRSDFTRIILNQERTHRDMRNLNVSLRDIDEKFARHMPKRPKKNTAPKVTYDPDAHFDMEAYRQSNEKMMAWANRQQEEKQPVFDQKLTDQYGTPAFITPN